MVEVKQTFVTFLVLGLKYEYSLLVSTQFSQL